MWQTKITIPESDLQFTHSDKILSLGSCFADEIGERLVEMRFDVLINPFGVLYNPHSLAKNMATINGRSNWDHNQCFLHQGLWRHLDFHSRVSKATCEEYIEHVTGLIARSGNQLKNSSLVILTLGTSFVWETADHEIVGNCHKLPARQFTRRMLDVAEIAQSINSIYQDIKSINTTCKLILTVSPVRHLRDGLIDNTWSKSRLVDGCRTIENKYEDISYFPSYEIIMDELRDYRFYASDMIHPAKESVDYIFSRFLTTHFRDVPEELLKIIKRINNSQNHRPIEEHSDAHQKFIKRTEELIALVREKYHVNL